jgi:cyclic pyranopterin phosphate synthase
MPREVFGSDFVFLPRDEILTFEEIARVVASALPLGLEKVRLTGGEPLLRRGLADLVAQLRALPGADASHRLDLALTTNGALLPRHAGALRDAGLDRVTVSLDALDPDTFARMNDTRVPVERVLEGIDAARRAGLDPVKVNAVVRRGINEDQILPLARRFHGTGTVLRFIEFMDVGETNRWRRDEVVSGAEIVERIGTELPLEPVPPSYPGEVARRFRYADGGGEIGVVTSVTAPFCGDCTRARLAADGKLYTCLFSRAGTDLRAVVRDASAAPGAVSEALARIWRGRDDRYSELRAAEPSAGPADDPAGKPADGGRVEMSYIGG